VSRAISELLKKKIQKNLFYFLISDKTKIDLAREIFVVKVFPTLHPFTTM